MGYSTPLSTPDGSPRVLVVDSSTPWAENGLHDDLSTINAINNPPRPRSRFGYASTVNNRCRIRIYNKLLLLTIGMMVLLWWYGGGGSKQSIQYGKGIPTRQQELAGMKFISANHPFIRVCSPQKTTTQLTTASMSVVGPQYQMLRGETGLFQVRLPLDLPLNPADKRAKVRILTSLLMAVAQFCCLCTTRNRPAASHP